MGDLIARLATAEGPSRGLDAEVMRQTLPRTYLGKPVAQWGTGHNGWWECCTKDGRRRLIPWTTPAYTASLDCALALVPEGWRWSVRRQDHGFYRASVYQVVPDCVYDAATAPLAVCVAALRARQPAEDA